MTFPLHIPSVRTHVTTEVAVPLQKIDTIHENPSRETTMLRIMSRSTEVLAAAISSSTF